MAIGAKKITFVQLSFDGAGPGMALHPAQIEIFLEGVFVMELHRSDTSVVSTAKTGATLVRNTLLLESAVSIGTLLSVAPHAPRAEVFTSAGVEGVERKVCLTGWAAFRFPFSAILGSLSVG